MSFYLLGLPRVVAMVKSNGYDKDYPSNPITNDVSVVLNLSDPDDFDDIK